MDAPTAPPVMMPRLKALILRLLHEHRVMTMATLRPDGWPQATTVGYVNDSFLLYLLCGTQHAEIRQYPARPARFDRDRQRCRKSHAGAGLVARRACQRGQRPIRVRRDWRAAAAKVSGIRRLACAAGAARRPPAYRAGAKAHAGRASAHRAGHHLGVGLR